MDKQLGLLLPRYISRPVNSVGLQIELAGQFVGTGSPHAPAAIVRYHVLISRF